MSWPEEDRDWVIALGRVQRNTGDHGEWLPDATSRRADPQDYDVPNPIRYKPTGPYMNWAVKAVKDAEAAHQKEAGEGANLNGVYFGVEAVEY